MITSTTKSALILLAFVSLFGIPAFGQVIQTEVQKLIPIGLESDDSFGHSVAVDGDTAVVGAFVDDDSGTLGNGAAYVFTRSGGVWTEQAKLLASDKANYDWFGWSLALDGDTAIIGAVREDDSGTPNNGAAYVFTRSGGVWTEQAKLLASDKARWDYFGVAVALDGDTAVIGAYRDDDSGTTSNGAAYVFTRSGGVWTEQAKLLASDKASIDFFGYSVAVDGDTAVIGAEFKSDGGTTNNGAAYVFTRSGSVWTEQAKLLAGDKANYDFFGWSLALDGDTAVLGAYGEDDSGTSDNGAAYVFTRSGGVWTEQAKLLASDKDNYDRFGYSVALDGNTALIGAPEDPFRPKDGGGAYVFTRSGGVWTEQVKLLASDRDSYDYLGLSVAIDGDTAVIGGHSNIKDDKPGAAYVFAPIGITSVEIDIKPGSSRNPINLKSKGNIPVAILTSGTFDATQVNWETVRFGPSGATERHLRVHVKDANYDGYMDVLLHFKTRDTGILCGDTEATLTGETFSGVEFSGSDAIKIVKCPKNEKKRR